MGKLTLYHGSQAVIESPQYGLGKSYNDYGRGFYCTEHIELAKEWACTEDKNGFANRYEIETDGLKILNLSDDEYTVLNWLAILLVNRRGRVHTPVAALGIKYLTENFLPDYGKADLIVGYRADDSYFSFVRSFVMNSISLAQLGRAMRLGKLGEQYVLKSPKAFEALRFMDYTTAENYMYYAKKKARDDAARSAFYKELENGDINGIFMRDIIREEMKPDDPRLR
ncbi:MAG: DUF3990 domain-containing protein [Clostridia bacterium]|nr:DUF3990 domain-containing protein [Clostridia bacterium]